VSFWDKLDYIGVDCYVPMYDHAGGAFFEGGEALLYGLSHAYGKKVLFTEIGIASQEGANSKPWEWQDNGKKADMDVQVAYFKTFLDHFGKASWFAGFWAWTWDAEAKGGPDDKSMVVQGKPVIQLFEDYFRQRSAAAAPGMSPAQKLQLSLSVQAALSSVILP
jgi:hypothetical protein